MYFPLKFTHLVAGATNNGGEDSPGGVITGETGFAHAGAIVNDKSSNVFVTHVGIEAVSRTGDWSEHTQEPATSVDFSKADLAFYTRAG